MTGRGLGKSATSCASTSVRKSVNETNVISSLDNTGYDIQETRDDSGGDDAEEDATNEDEEEHGEVHTTSGV